MAKSINQYSPPHGNAEKTPDPSISSSKVTGKMSEFSSRTLDQEPDTIAIIPKYPDYFVVGTYSLVLIPDDSLSNTDGGRKGSLHILPFAPAATDVVLDRKDFAFGIYDIHFHPQLQNLLGVATSDAEILFFYTVVKHSPSDSLESIHLVELGRITVEEPHPDDGRHAIITQFQFLTPPGDSPILTPTHHPILLTATTQFGNTKLIKVTLPSLSEPSTNSKNLESQILDIHKQSFDLEAWTVLPIFTGPSILHVLSGGDDSQLIISSVETPHDTTFTDMVKDTEFDLDVLTTTRLLTDKRTHEAGVVHICDLGSHPSQLSPSSSTADTPATRLILTGSYDETLRLFLFIPSSPTHPTTKFTLLSSIPLGGGVWRIQLLTDYATASSHDYILLIAAHTAGACIFRLSVSVSETEIEDGNGIVTGKWVYGFQVEKWFTEGHESLVYAVGARKVLGAGVDGGDCKGGKLWGVLSASFYDRVVCGWRWVDEGL